MSVPAYTYLGKTSRYDGRGKNTTLLARCAAGLCSVPRPLVLSFTHKAFPIIAILGG